MPQCASFNNRRSSSPTGQPARHDADIRARVTGPMTWIDAVNPTGEGDGVVVGVMTVGADGVGTPWEREEEGSAGVHAMRATDNNKMLDRARMVALTLSRGTTLHDMYRYCPNCREEYVASMTHCHECGTELVDELPPEPVPVEPVRENLVEVYEASRQQAELIRSLLEGNGIPAVTFGAAGGAYPVNVGDLGRVQVLVQEIDEDSAREVITEATGVERPPVALSTSASARSEPGPRLLFDQPRWLLAGIAAFLILLWLLFDPRFI
jgi:Putative prokaryotic signal transducing protein